MSYQYSDYSDVVYKVFSTIHEGVKINDKVVNKQIAENIARLYKLGLYTYHRQYSHALLEDFILLPHESQLPSGKMQISCSCNCGSTYETSYDGEQFQYEPLEVKNCIGIGMNNEL